MLNARKVQLFISQEERCYGCKVLLKAIACSAETAPVSDTVNIHAEVISRSPSHAAITSVSYTHIDTYTKQVLVGQWSHQCWADLEVSAAFNRLWKWLFLFDSRTLDVNLCTFIYPWMIDVFVCIYNTDLNISVVKKN